MEATQAVVTSQRAERRRFRFRIFARRSDGTGPHFLPDAQNANISGGAFTQVVGDTIIHQYNISGGVPSTESGGTPVLSSTSRSTAEPIYGANGERLQPTNVTVPANRIPPSRLPQDIYQDLLDQEGYGFPFWVPSPNRLFQEYRYKGVSIGDVGVFDSDGGFDYLFNICLPANNPRNPERLPPNFQPLYPPLGSFDVMEHDQFSPEACVVSRDIRINDGDVSLTSRVSTTFVNHGLEGAILVMPNGASAQKLVNRSRFDTYLTPERILSFYQFANDVQNGLGRGIGNGRLRIVYGCTKGTSFAMASVPPSAPSEPPTRLQFNKHDRTTGPASSTTGAIPTTQDRYFWNLSGRAQHKVGPSAIDQRDLDRSRVAAGLENQCFFVRALNLELSQEIWDHHQLSSFSMIASEAAHPGKSKTNSNSEAGSTGNPLFAGAATSTSTHRGGDTASPDMNNTDNEVIQLELHPHPSAVLKKYAFQKYPRAKVLILSDRDWLYLTELNENILNPSKARRDHVNTTELHVSGYELAEKMLDLVDQESEESKDGVIFFKPRGINAEFSAHVQSLAKRLNTMKDVKTYLFGEAGANRCDVVAHIVKTALHEYNQNFWQSVAGRPHCFERDASFTSELHGHPWTPISVLEVLEAKKFKDLAYLPPDMTNLKNTCLLPTGESNLVIIGILAHRLQERFRKRGQVEDLDEAIFYYKHVVEKHDNKGRNGNFSTSSWVYPAALIGLSAALYIRLQIQKQESDYQMLLDYIEKQKQLDFLFLDRDTVKSIIESVVPRLPPHHSPGPAPPSTMNAPVIGQITMPEKATFFKGVSGINTYGTPQFDNITPSKQEKSSYMSYPTMEASFFKNAKNVKIGGKSQFNNIVAGRDVHQTNYTRDTYNTNSNNKITTTIKDSFNDNSRHIINNSSSKEDSSEWTEGSTESSEESDDSDQERRRKPPPRTQRKPKPGARAAKAKARARAARRPPPAQAPGQVESEPEVDVRPATPPEESPSSERDGTRPEFTQTQSAPVLPTQAASGPPTPASPPTSAPPHLTVPVPQPQSTNTSSTSLAQSVATSPGIPQHSPGLELHRRASAPAPSTVGSAAGSSMAAPPVTMQKLLVGGGKPDLSARYRYLVTQEDTRYEIRRKLVSVAQSMPKDKFFILKDQAMTANSILELIEGSKEKIQAKKEVVQLCLESHAVAFITIMATETETPDQKKIYSLLKILNKVEELMDKVVHKNALSRLNPFKKSENEKLVKAYRGELESWLRDFQSNKDTTVDFALHKASQALSEAVFVEQQYNITVQAPPAQQTSSSSQAPSNSRAQTPGLLPGSTSISDITQSAVSLGSGSASVIKRGGFF